MFANGSLGYLTAGEVAVSLSQRAAWQMLMRHPTARNVLVFEDDFEASGALRPLLAWSTQRSSVHGTLRAGGAGAARRIAVGATRRLGYADAGPLPCALRG